MNTLLLQSLENELKMIKHESLFAHVIRENPGGSVPMIADQIKDSRLVVVSIIGERLVKIIEQLPLAQH